MSAGSEPVGRVHMHTSRHLAAHASSRPPSCPGAADAKSHSGSATVDPRQVRLYIKTPSNGNLSTGSHRPQLQHQSSQQRSVSENAWLADADRPISAQGSAGDAAAPHWARAGSALSVRTTDPGAGLLTHPSEVRRVQPRDSTGANRSSGLPAALLDLTIGSSSRPRSQYLDRIVFQIDENLYMGGVDAANNMNLLCRLNVEYIVDLCNVDPDDLPRDKRPGGCPCLCAKETKHSRAKMIIDISRDSTDDLTDNFIQANEFIEKARSRNKAALVHSYDGSNRAALFIVQYLMRAKRLSASEAERRLKEMLVDSPLQVRIGDNFHKALTSRHVIWRYNNRFSCGQKICMDMTLAFYYYLYLTIDLDVS